jgi:hypothetical protein
MKTAGTITIITRTNENQRSFITYSSLTPEKESSKVIQEIHIREPITKIVRPHMEKKDTSFLRGSAIINILAALVCSLPPKIESREPIVKSRGLAVRRACMGAFSPLSDQAQSDMNQIQNMINPTNTT